MYQYIKKLLERIATPVVEEVMSKIDNGNLQIQNLHERMDQLTEKSDLLNNALYDITKKTETGMAAINDRLTKSDKTIEAYLDSQSGAQEQLKIVKESLDQHIDALAWETCSRLDIVNDKVGRNFTQTFNILDAMRLQMSVGRETHENQNIVGFKMDEQQEFLMREEQKKHRKQMLDKIARGEKLKICILIDNVAQWSLKNLYNKLLNSEYFKPYVVVVPNPDQGYDDMVKNLEHTFCYMLNEGFCTIKTYIPETDAYYDLKGQLNPDILLYNRYWVRHFYYKYYIANFLDKLNFLIPYGLDVVQVENINLYTFELCQKVDRLFTFSELHKMQYQNERVASNLHITGSPILDIFFDKTYKPNDDVWRKQEKTKKRVIWAPHHSTNMPDTFYQFNAFFEIYSDILEIAEKYKESIQFAFRPHPMLRHKLDTLWGKEKSDEYYRTWNNMDNGQVSEDDYTDLFLTSDAMILDSCSFIAEYTAVNKPMFFTIGKATRVKLNDFGQKAFETLYSSADDLKSEIHTFLDRVVLGGDDYLHKKRESFVDQYLKPVDGKTAADSIYDNICEEIWQGKISE